MAVLAGRFADMDCRGCLAEDFRSSRSPHSRKSFSRREARAVGEARRLGVDGMEISLGAWVPG